MRRTLYITKKDRSGKTIMDMDRAVFAGSGKLWFMIYKGKVYDATLLNNNYYRTLPDDKGNYFLSFIFSEE